MQRTFVRSLLVTFAVFAVLLSAELLAEWWRLGEPASGDVLSWAGVNNAKLVDVLSPTARAYNNILAMLLATIGLAIPLTANMHTPKLISMFLEDNINRVVLFVMAFGAANVLFVDYIIGPKFAPMWLFRGAIFLALLGWVLLIPYFFYVVRFLDPSQIVARLKEKTLRAIDRSLLPGTDLEAFQDDVHDMLMQIGTIVVKSLDRSDRGVAIEGVWSFKVILDAYGRAKPSLPAAAFQCDRHDFVGLSAEALELVNESRTWMERKVLMQLVVTFRAALSKASDTVTSMSDAVRVIAEHAHERGDVEARTLALHTLNTFVRSAIQAKNVHAVYDVFLQYRVLARHLRDDAEVLRQLGSWFHVYADAARAEGLEFANDLAVFDLGSMTRRAFEVQSPARTALLDDVLALRHERRGAPAPLAVKAKVMLGAFFVERGLVDEAARVHADLRDVPPDLMRRLEADLLAAPRKYHELTDREVNLEWVEPSRREPLKLFVSQFLGAGEKV